jgi:hypothetical protein
VDTATGEAGEEKLVHARGDAERFYRGLPVPSMIGLEATGNSEWFAELVEDLGHALWIGDAAQIRASYVRQQKTDKRDAEHTRKLLEEVANEIRRPDHPSAFRTDRLPWGAKPTHSRRHHATSVEGHRNHLLRGKYS